MSVEYKVELDAEMCNQEWIKKDTKNYVYKKKREKKKKTSQR